MVARRPRPTSPDPHLDATSTGSADRSAPGGPAIDPDHLIALIRETVPPVHRAGLPFVAGAAGLAVLTRRHRLISTPAALAAGACAAFFRHPSRVPPTESGAVVAPADGTVALVDTAVPPAEADLGDRPRPRVSTFLSIFDVHVQRVPIGGSVVSVTHQPGTFLSADLPEASTANERTTVVIDTDTGHRIAVVQIAGLLARRIVCDVGPGDRLAVGDTYGLIRFGSRVDVYLPEDTDPLVRVGQRAVGAETLLATLA